MPANLENSAGATGLENSVFIPIPKKGNARECSNYCTAVLISHASKVTLKILQVRLQQYISQELPDIQTGFKKAEEPEIKLPAFTGSYSKQRNSRKTSPSASLAIQKPRLCGTQQTVGNSQRDDNTRPPSFLLRNLYAGQEATVRTGCGTMDWFTIRKGVRHGCALSPSFFNFCAEYIM